MLLAVSATVTAIALLAGCGTQTESASDANSEAGAQAEEATTDDRVYSFKIDYPNAENSAVYPVLVRWADYVREQSGGRIDATIYSGGALGALPDCVNNCVGGLTDGFWSGVTIYPGVFPATEALALPMLGANSQEVVTSALNTMVKENPTVAAEWENLRVVALHSATASPVLFKLGKKVVSSADIKNVNLRISNAYTTEWMEVLGANPVSCGINDGYEYFEKGIINGGLFFFDQLQSSALYEPIDDLLVADTIYPLTMFCLNKERYEELPDDLKAVIDDSGTWFTEQLPAVYNAQKADMLTKCEENNVKITYPNEAFIAEMTAAAEPAWQLWVDAMNEKGYDGQALLDAARGYIEQYNTIYPPAQ
jgi:TRAP-type C4-dicarboxylate transport system substrate-binding protein